MSFTFDRFKKNVNEIKGVIGFTGGTGKANPWPHPNNPEFNEIIKNTVNIYGIGSKKEKELIESCQKYLKSRIEGIMEHKIVRDTEEYFRAMNLKFKHGHGKDYSERQHILNQCSFVMCVGNWQQDKDNVEQFKMATVLNLPIFEIRYENLVPVKEIVRYLQPVRPIQDTVWDDSKKEDVLMYENEDGVLEIMDGNHRHEFATRMGGDIYLSGWVIKKI